MKSHVPPARAGVPFRASAIVALALALLITSPAAAQDPAAADLVRRIDGFLAASKATDNESARCRSFDGKAVTPAAFDALAQRLQSVERPLGSPVLLVPVQRDYVEFDGKFVRVEAGAVATGKLSADGMADGRAQIMLAAHARELPDWSRRLTVGLATSEHPLGSFAARNLLGQAIRVTTAERRTRGLALSAKRLFPAAVDADTPVMGFEAAKAVAVRTVRLALVVEPEAPFVVDGTSPGEAATAQRPVQYTERATVIVAAPQCLLAVGPTNRVLASADVGTN